GAFVPMGNANVAIMGAAGVLTDAYTPTGAPLSAVIDSQPNNGQAAFSSDGSFTYTPTQGFVGTDSVTYHVDDGTNTSNEGTVFIQVMDRPSAANSYYTTAVNQALTVSAPGMIAGDYSPSGNPLTATLDSQPSNGNVNVNSDGSFTY